MISHSTKQKRRQQRARDKERRAIRLCLIDKRVDCWLISRPDPAAQNRATQYFHQEVRGGTLALQVYSTMVQRPEVPPVVRKSLQWGSKRPWPDHSKPNRR